MRKRKRQRERERISHRNKETKCAKSQLQCWKWQPCSVLIFRLLVRTNELLSLRGCVLEESIPSLCGSKSSSSSDKAGKSIPTREVLEFVCPEIQLSCLHLGSPSPSPSPSSSPASAEEELLRLDEAYMQSKYKVGLMYCREGQRTEEEMYNNEEGGDAFEEFLDLIGSRVRLKGFTKYKAGLCNKSESSIYRRISNASPTNVTVVKSGVETE